MAEMVPGGFDAPPELRGSDAVAFAARLGAELGADFIKAPYCDDFARVTASTFAPVVILGGSKGSEAATSGHHPGRPRCGRGRRGHGPQRVPEREPHSHDPGRGRSRSRQRQPRGRPSDP